MNFHYLARAVIIKENKILLARALGKSHTFLPGGHIEMGEAAEDALRREIFEETGLKSTVLGFIGAYEHIWPEDLKDNHEINLIFTVSLDDLDLAIELKSKEGHIEFLWVSFDELEKYQFMSDDFRIKIEDYLKQPKSFWGSSIVG